MPMQARRRAHCWSGRSILQATRSTPAWAGVLPRTLAVSSLNKGRRAARFRSCWGIRGNEARMGGAEEDLLRFGLQKGGGGGMDELHNLLTQQPCRYATAARCHPRQWKLLRGRLP